MLRYLSLHTLLFLLLHTREQTGVCEVAQDNIALPQEESRQFILPAPGIRHRPSGQPKQAQQQNQYGGGLTQASNSLPDFGINLQNLQPSSGVVGNLLPLQPSGAMAQVVALDVACQRDQMTVRIVFDSPFPGLMYAKGFYGRPQCNFVAPGTGGREFEFIVLAGTCGTQYVDTPGSPPYLENVIVIQNEPGIQEVWDTARGVRCVFDGSEGRDSSQRVSAALTVDMLDQQVVSFSADTSASASLDIQVGRGPFAPSASGFVKIGEMMTMVVIVEGPANADLLVRQCIAHDGSGQNPYQLTDDNGCVLGSKKKILGSWQKSRDTGSPQIPVVAFSHFQAFKFPDKSKVYIECQVDLCNNGCPVCPEDGSGRKRRAVPVSSRSKTGRSLEIAENEEKVPRTNSIIAEGKNESSGEPVRLGRAFQVISPQDYSVNRDTPITVVAKESGGNPGDMCMSIATFVAGLVGMFIILVLSSIVTAALCIRVRTIPSTASTYPPDSSFHAFSTVSGKTL